MGELITQTLPPAAVAAAKNWEKSRGMPAFLQAYQPYPNSCKFCQGVGFIYLKLCSKGPYQSTISTKDPVTWFDGNERYGKGWYIIAETMAFECTSCGGRK